MHPYSFRILSTGCRASLKTGIDKSNYSLEEETVFYEEELTDNTPSIVINEGLEKPQLTTKTAFVEVINMSVAMVVTMVFLSLNNYENSYLLNTHNNHNSSDAAAAGALINIFNSMAFTSLFAVTASNYIKSIPLVIAKDYK